MAKKRVFLLITKSNWGGAQRYVYDLATNLPPEQFAVTVIAGGHGELLTRLAAAGIATRPLAGVGRDIAPGADLWVFWTLLKLFWRERPDIVHVNSSKIGGLGALAARLARVPRVIFTAHGWPFREPRPRWQQLLIKAASWLTLALSHQVIAVSAADAQVFASPKINLIYNGIAPLKLGSGDVIRRAFPPGVKITGTIGELTRNKNQRALVEEARHNPELYVAIVGEGELRTELEGLIKRYGLATRVKLFGFLPAAEVLKGFDTFALPSLKEGLPYVLLEAKQAGLPIVANRVGGVWEILDSTDPAQFTLQRMVEETIKLYNR